MFVCLFDLQIKQIEHYMYKSDSSGGSSDSSASSGGLSSTFGRTSSDDDDGPSSGDDAARCHGGGADDGDSDSDDGGLLACPIVGCPCGGCYLSIRTLREHVRLIHPPNTRRASVAGAVYAAAYSRRHGV